ncbi:hypothetical protein JCM10207_009219 [Rhodosporidiobolus poonsookiae]
MSYKREEQVAGPAGRWIAPPAPSPAPSTSHDSSFLFTAYHRSFRGRAAADSFVWLDVTSRKLLQALQAVFPLSSDLRVEGNPGIDGRAVYVQRKKLEAIAAAWEEGERDEVVEAVSTLVSYLEEEFAYVAETIASYPLGTISWSLLWALLNVGEDLEAVHDVTGEKIAVRLEAWTYVQEAMGRTLKLSCSFIQWAGTCYHTVPLTRKIPEFKDLRPIHSLLAKPLSEDVRRSLQQRGALYKQYAGQVHALHTGFFFTRSFTGPSRALGDGQVIVDVKSFRRSNPTLDSWGDDVIDTGGKTQWASSSASASRPCPPPEDAQLHLLPPSIQGFSLRAKRWGEFLISRLAPMTWCTESFSHLVIPNSYRRILKALVTVHATDLKQQLMTDVVEGKGNGLVMALHGSPGTGKTLTAEAIAEHLRRPLYVVSAGELGTTAQGLERALNNVLELATQWNAVLLIDEADIFLTKRDPMHLERNALVGICLRLLEYFTGVLILTTNNIEQFDEAFLSRFAVVLQFDALDEASRRTLWERFLLKAADVPSLTDSSFDLDRLASFPLNGRDIKHAVQTAQAIALVEKETLAMEHLEEVLSVAKSGYKGSGV